MLTAERARFLLSYNEQTGVITWNVDHRSRQRAGSVAGSNGGNGYLRVRIDGARYQVHRVIHLMMTGSFPAEVTDHRNGVRSDNRWCNIRPASKSENAHNRKPSANNTSGYPGVTYNPMAKKWQARICLQWKRQHLGMFETPEDAGMAYLRAKQELHPFQPIPRAA